MRDLAYSRRVAMALRRAAEIVDEKGAESLAALIRLGADELDATDSEDRPSHRAEFF